MILEDQARSCRIFGKILQDHGKILQNPARS
jgi:hypothetical protein